MNKRPITPIFIALEASYLLLGLLLAVSSVAILIVWFYVDSRWLKASLIFFVLINTGYFGLRDALLKLKTSWKTLEINALGELRLSNNKGEIFKPNLSGNTFVHEYLTVLKGQKPFFKLGLPPVILLNLNKDHHQHTQHRKLRVWLRWGRHNKRKHADANQTADFAV